MPSDNPTITDLLLGLDRYDKKPMAKKDYLKPPFQWTGGKSFSVPKIVPMLPYTSRYVEVFGGSGAVLLGREPSKLEVYNDIFSGLVCFYRCLRDPAKYQQMINWLDLNIHSREEFYWNVEHWHDISDDVERACRWYYTVVYSFNGLGRSFGRTLSPVAGLAGAISRKIKLFPEIHARFRDVQVENQNWLECMSDYDHPETVFYCDPPYVDAYRGTYKNEMSPDDHREFLDHVFRMKGFVAVSGYPNPLYDSRDWDSKETWDVRIMAKGLAKKDHANPWGTEDRQDVRGKSTECLWIKEAR